MDEKEKAPDGVPVQTNIDKLVEQIEKSENKNELRLFLTLFSEPII